MSRLSLTVALTLALAGAAPVLAKNQHKPDCSKTPGHPDCVYPTNPQSNHMPTAEQSGAPKPQGK